MKIAQTSLVVFLSRLIGSALGFVATLYFARELGAEVIGIYALVMTVISWLFLAGDLGVGGATTKRISESEEDGSYLSASIVLVASLAIALSIAVIVAQPVLESYISGFDQYVAVSVVWFVVAILFARLFRSTVNRALKGERKVHIAGLLDPVKIGGQSLVQIGLVFLGYGLLGMLVGYLVGTIVVGSLGVLWVSTRPAIPGVRHFRSLFDYAKFSWLGSLESRTYNEVDILLLGVFVQSSLVGVYAVVWSLAKFLDLFGGAIRSTMFPEISHVSTHQSDGSVAGLIEDSLAFTGLIVLPGLVGGTILADRLLRLYGPDFQEGAAVLALLILSILLYSYQKQLLNALNGINRPELAFRVNAVFIALNAGLNVVLIWQYGIEGAAVASVISVAVSLALGYRILDRLVDFSTPLGEIARQAAAAALMGGVVWVVLELVERTGIVRHNAFLVVVLVALGGGIYFTTLFAISQRFRYTVRRNLPVDVPFV